jgi:Kef-type K+ transport system membrane component KefB
VELTAPGILELGLVLLLAAAAGWLARALRMPAVVAWLLGRAVGLRADARQLAVGLGQAGEFSFVLASAALGLGFIGDGLYAAVLGTVALSIAGSTILVRRVGRRGPAVPAAS